MKSIYDKEKKGRVRANPRKKAAQGTSPRSNEVVLKVVGYGKSPRSASAMLRYIAEESEHLREPTTLVDKNGAEFAASTRNALLREWALKPNSQNLSKDAKEAAPAVRREMSEKDRLAARQVVHLVLSFPKSARMPEHAMNHIVQEVLRPYQDAGFPYLFARHMDADNQHAHIVMAMRSSFGQRLRIQPRDIQAMRQEAVRAARRMGITIEATLNPERKADRERRQSQDAQRKPVTIFPRTLEEKAPIYTSRHAAEYAFRNSGTTPRRPIPPPQPVRLQPLHPDTAAQLDPVFNRMYAQPEAAKQRFLELQAEAGKLAVWYLDKRPELFGAVNEKVPVPTNAKYAWYSHDWTMESQRLLSAVYQTDYAAAYHRMTMVQTLRNLHERPFQVDPEPSRPVTDEGRTKRVVWREMREAYDEIKRLEKRRSETLDAKTRLDGKDERAQKDHTDRLAGIDKRLVHVNAELRALVKELRGQNPSPVTPTPPADPVRHGAEQTPETPLPKPTSQPTPERPTPPIDERTRALLENPAAHLPILTAEARHLTHLERTTTDPLERDRATVQRAHIAELVRIGEGRAPIPTPPSEADLTRQAAERLRRHGLTIDQASAAKAAMDRQAPRPAPTPTASPADPMRNPTHIMRKAPQWYAAHGAEWEARRSGRPAPAVPEPRSITGRGLPGDTDHKMDVHFTANYANPIAAKGRFLDMAAEAPRLALYLINHRPQTFGDMKPNAIPREITNREWPMPAEWRDQARAQLEMLRAADPTSARDARLIAAAELRPLPTRPEYRQPSPASMEAQAPMWYQRHGLEYEARRTITALDGSIPSATEQRPLDHRSLPDDLGQRLATDMRAIFTTPQAATARFLELYAERPALALERLRNAPAAFGEIKPDAPKTTLTPRNFAPGAQWQRDARQRIAQALSADPHRAQRLENAKLLQRHPSRANHFSPMRDPNKASAPTREPQR